MTLTSTATSRQPDTTRTPAFTWPSLTRPVEDSSSKWEGRSRHGKNAGLSLTRIAGRLPTTQVRTSFSRVSADVQCLPQQWRIDEMPRMSFDHGSVYVLCCRQTWDQDQRRHLLPSHRGSVLWPFEERTQSESACLCVYVCGFRRVKYLTSVCPLLFSLPTHASLYVPFLGIPLIISYLSNMTFPSHSHRAPILRWPSVWRPTIECTTWWLRLPKPCVSGWMLS